MAIGQLKIGTYGWVAAASLVAGFALAGPSDADPVRLRTFKTHSRLTVAADPSVPIEWKNEGARFSLTLKGIGLADVAGGGRGGLEGLHDPRIAGLELSESADGVVVRGQWKFPQGGAAPVHPRMEAFTYREKETAAFVVDFWLKDGITVAEQARRDAVARRLASAKKSHEENLARAARKDAREKARAEAEDNGHFCRQPMSEGNDVFLRFLPVQEKVDFGQWFPTAMPDSNFSYYEPKGHSKDAQYMRLALDLYRQGKHALVNRTLDFFEKDFPTSEFKSEIQFLRANVLMRMDLMPEANQILSRLLADERKSPEALHAAMYLAGKQVAANNRLAALETFLWLESHHADNRLNWVFHLGAAECARSLRQTDQAAKEYQWIAENGPDRKAQAQGALRIGDLYMLRFQYDQGLASYYQALERFKKESADFPVVHLNRAEALYGLGEFDRARVAFKAFLDKYPAHPAGWRATFRLGEIEGREKAQSPESREWFYDTINRYPFSPGTVLARMRLIPCGDHGGMDEAGAVRFYEQEVAKFDYPDEVVMDRFKDFRALARVRMLITLGSEESVVAAAIDELRKSPQIETRRVLGTVLAALFRKSVLKLLDHGRKLEALTFYQRNVDAVPMENGRTESDYLIRLSQAASDLQLGTLAQAIMKDYDRAQAMTRASGRALAALPPSGSKEAQDGDIELRLQTSERDFTQAKALWISGGIARAADVTQLLERVQSESRFSYEREIILGLIAERTNKPMAALRHAARAQILAPKSEAVGGRDLRVDAWVAALEARVGDPKAAFAMYRNLEARLAAKAAPSRDDVSEILGVPATPPREALVAAQAEILERQGKWGEAAGRYDQAIQSGFDRAQTRYGYARALLKAGGEDNRRRALATLEKLVAPAPVPSAAPADRTPAAANPEAAKKPAKEPAQESAQESEEDKFWKKLAGETLANERTAEKTKRNAKEGMN